ncbi:tfuA protein [Azospirillum sp. TSH100]|uniref:TfuA-like protein n=1 Tax=Azospirillum sp. TSH100 TaxID=652764 RepID=UPI000D613119|nr:TfuA-like protein [Azospirillum sp. TSH100]PWC73666.1 tfuA protein [Azospirillum sp. TSH100]QCG91231.1 tfuA protein [Azospirillum sp. TSH100]
MSGVYIFLGPTLPCEDAALELDATYLPPVAQGDVLRLCAEKPAAIGIIDGFFESVPSVWHKEILYAIHAGIPVFGASSMGALRAAELYPFGMIGVGAIFEAFRDGRLEDDDEVAVIHGPAELGYTSLSEAMVNIRRTLSDAVAERVLSAETALRLESIAKELPYRERGYGRMLRLGGDIGLQAAELTAFRSWLPQGRFDQKRQDAKAMLRTMARWLGRSTGEDVPSEARFHFERTILWERAMRDAAPLAM